MGVDASSFLFEEVRRVKRGFDEALRRGDNAEAARLAGRMCSLLRELARYRRWGSGEVESLIREYEEIRRRLLSPQSVTGGLRVSRGGGGLDAEFDREALKLIAKAVVGWDDIAGLEEVKRSLMEALVFSIARPSTPVRFEAPRRFLLFGPPGCGKTLLAMAASNMLKATFFNVSVDRVLSRYVGDSPRMVSAIFRQAIRLAPSLIFFDEVEALVSRRDLGREGVTGLVQTFLTELDGFTSKCLGEPVIVMAATNKPWILDEAVVSRFERRIYVPLPNRSGREGIFRLHLEGRGFEVEGITYGELADLTEGYSGRDIRAVCQRAIIKMLRRANPGITDLILRVDGLDGLRRFTYRVEPIRRDELVEAINSVKPAVSPEEVVRYEEWAERYSS